MRRPPQSRAAEPRAPRGSKIVPAETGATPRRDAHSSLVLRRAASPRDYRRLLRPSASATIDAVSRARRRSPARSSAQFVGIAAICVPASARSPSGFSEPPPPPVERLDPGATRRPEARTAPQGRQVLTVRETRDERRYGPAAPTNRCSCSVPRVRRPARRRVKTVARRPAPTLLVRRSTASSPLRQA